MAQKNPDCRNGRVAPLSGQQTIPAAYLRSDTRCFAVSNTMAQAFLNLRP